MSSFLENIEGFRGTGEVNEQGLSLEEFLDKYNADKYPKPSVTADVLVFAYKKDTDNWFDDLQLLMIKRRNHPSIGYWALPGGFAEMREDLIDTAKRELEEETGLTGIPLAQVYTYGEVERDPRDRVITASYLAFVEQGTCKAKAGDDAKDAKWWDVKVELVNTIRNGEVMEKEYQLCMHHQGEKELTAKVVEEVEMSSPLKIAQFRVRESNGIAFDHAKYIVEGYAYLDRRLNC